MKFNLLASALHKESKKTAPEGATAGKGDANKGTDQEKKTGDESASTRKSASTHTSSRRHSKKFPIRRKASKKKHRGDAETGDAEKEEEKSNFPCCFYIPLDIAMQGFALLDIIYYSLYALGWSILLGLEPFAGKDKELIQESWNNNSNPLQKFANSRLLKLGEVALRTLLERSKAQARAHRFNSLSTDEQLDPNDFHETTTTLAPIDLNYALDKANEARVYSRIARQFQHFGQEVDDGCGREYFADYLYANQLDTTRNLFEEAAGKIISASLLYAVIGAILLATMCCFRGYIASKVLIIFLWYIQLVPSYLVMRAAVMSQSHRFCILQYGIGKDVQGQRIIFWSLLWPLLSYKPYEAFIWANYIRNYFNNKEGKLLDESYYSTAKLDERQHKQFTLNPNQIREEYQHHRRTVGRSHLFRRYNQKAFFDIAKREKLSDIQHSIGEIQAKRNSSSDG